MFAADPLLGFPTLLQIVAFDKRLASKTINSRLTQNGEPELDKG